MARKASRKPAPKKKPAAKTAKLSPRRPAPRRIVRPAAAEHRIAVASVAVHVRYGRGRTEEFELRGTAALNVGAPESVVRTTSVVRLAARSSGKGEDALSYNPASLSRNLILTLFVDDADLALLREIFVTGTGSELTDPALIVWAATAGPLAPDTAADAAVIEFGYSLDFDPGPALGSR